MVAENNLSVAAKAVGMERAGPTKDAVNEIATVRGRTIDLFILNGDFGPLHRFCRSLGAKSAVSVVAAILHLLEYLSSPLLRRGLDDSFRGYTTASNAD